MLSNMNRRKFLKLTGTVVLATSVAEHWADVVVAAAAHLHRPLLKKKE